MPVSAGIYNALMQPVKSVADYAADYDQDDIRKQGIQRNALMLQQSQAELADRERARKEGETLRNALATLGAGATPEQRISAMEGTGLPQGFTQADALRKTLIEQQRAEAQAAKDQAEAKAKEYALTRQKLEHGVQWLQVAQNPQQAAQMFADGVQKGYWGMQDAQQQAATIPQDPAQFQMWKRTQLAQILDAAKLLPTIQTRNTGGSTDTLAVDPLTGVPQVTGSVRNTMSPAEVASNGLGYARLRQEKELKQAELSKPFEVTGPEGSPILVQQDKAGKIVPVQGYQPKGGGTKVADAKEALALLDQAEPIAKTATGSTLGAAFDKVGQFFGYATPGSISAQQLKALEGALVAKMPKMSGPQSDKDVQLYRQMAAEIGDPSVPYERKAAAMQTVREIQERYAGMKPGESRPKPGAKPTVSNW